MKHIPGPGAALGVVRAQVQALASLPSTVLSLQTVVRSLAETVAAGAETMRTVQRVAGRLEALVDDLEQPLHELAPGLRRAARLLDDPVIDTIPDTLRQVQAEALPLLRTISETQARIAGIAQTTDRVMGLLDDTGTRLAAFPGAALLGSFAAARRPSAPPARIVGPALPGAPAAGSPSGHPTEPPD